MSEPCRKRMTHSHFGGYKVEVLAFRLVPNKSGNAVPMPRELMKRSNSMYLNQRVILHQRTEHSPFDNVG